MKPAVPEGGRGNKAPRDATLRGPIRMWLTVFSGDYPKETIEVQGTRFLIGRGEACDLAIDDPKVSREHAVILPSSGPFRVLRDLGSANGTLMDGRPIRPSVGFNPQATKEAQLTGGEWLHFGDTPVHVTLTDPRQAPVQATPPPDPDPRLSD